MTSLGSVVTVAAQVAPRFRCDDCRTTEGCAAHLIFMCETCGRPTRWRDGGDDDRPEDCSSCWWAWFEPRQMIAQALAEMLEAIF